MAAWEVGLLQSMMVGYAGRGDTIANLLVYIPIGIFLRLSLGGGARNFALTIAGGFLLSLLVEVGQFATRDRDPSLTDVFLNVISTVIGASLATWLWMRLIPVLAKARQAKIPTIAILLLLVWIAIHSAPFIPTLGMHKLRAALSPLKSFTVTLEGVSRWSAAWLILASVLRALLVRKRFLPGFVAAAAISLGMRLLFTKQAVSWNEIAGLGLSFPVAVFAPFLSAPLVLSFLLISGFSPYQFSSVPAPVGWVPFVGFLSRDWGSVYPVVLEKSYLYTGAVWLVYQAGFSRIVSGVSVAVVLAVVEWAQRYLPGRTPEVADPLIALLVILLLERKTGHTS